MCLDASSPSVWASPATAIQPVILKGWLSQLCEHGRHYTPQALGRILHNGGADCRHGSLCVYEPATRLGHDRGLEEKAEPRTPPTVVKKPKTVLSHGGMRHVFVWTDMLLVIKEEAAIDRLPNYM